MKIDKTRLKKSTSEVPSECQNLIDKLRACSRDELHAELSKVETWTFGKCELYHWIDILDKFDSILEDASICPPQHKFYITCDTSFDEEDQNLLLLVLHFTTLLIEHSFSRHLYNSMEHLITLLSSSNMRVVLGVLNLLYMFSKRSNFITRLNSEKRQALLCRLNFLAETWGGNDYGFGLADCCKADQVVPRTASTLYYEYFGQDGNWSWIHIKDIHLVNPPITPAEYMSNIIEERKDLSEEKLLHVFTRLRLAASFHKYSARLQFVQARLQALSVLVYANALQESAHTLLYPGLLDELVELLELQQSHLVEIRAAALRTLTSIIHLDRNPHFPKKPGSRLNLIIGVTGAASYHGFLPVLVRTCIATLTQPKQEEIDNMFPLPLATALFSFLYHLASYESGGEALVACGMMESLLRVINWPGNELEHITFVTRAVRVIDLITNIDMQAFHTHGGINSFISRLHMEVNLCRREQQYEIVLQSDELGLEDFGENEPGPSTSKDKGITATTDSKNAKIGCTCLPQRAALLKSMLNFLKKAIQDSAFSDSIRHVMEGTLPSSLKHIISNAEYYGPSLFLLATDVVTVYVFQEPSHLSSLQDNGLTEVLLHALLIKDVPATREVLGSLPNVFSALCLNARGLVSFVKYKPFERLFKVLLSPVYLAAMRRRRNSHPMSDTASNLGNAMDELIRHQPSLKFDATEAIIRLLEDLVQLGTDPKYVCWRAQSKTDLSLSPPPAARPAGNNEAGSSDEDDEDEEEASTSSHTQRDDGHQDNSSQSLNEKTPIALVDYILNVMKFVDAILSNNSTDDHCRAFVAQGGLKPLLAIVGLPNLPVDCPITQAAQAVASVCKSVLNLGHEPQVLQIGLEHLLELVQTMKPLYNHLTAPAGSVLLRELANAPNLETAFSTASATPLLHAMGAAHGYIVMFVHVCRTGRTEIRTMALQKWGQDTEYGRMLLYNLVRLYTALVWESTLLLALCSDDIIPAGCDFGKEDLDKLLPQDMRNDAEVPWSSINQDSGSNGMTTAMEALSTNPSPVSMDVDTNQPLSLIERANESRLAATAQQLKYIRTLLGASSRLGRALAELFGLLVKLCVGSPIRQRRGQNIHPTPSLTIPASRDIARVLSYILVEGLAWEKLPVTPVPKFRLTFLICSVGFTSPMLFDEKRYAYHIMLQMFVDEGGQTAFFDTFRWALSAGGTIPLHKGLEHPDLPEGTGEFLDAWLLLLEKMVNPKSILDTPHLIPARARKNGEEFDPVKYLNQIHKQAFNTIMMMWGKKPLKTYGGRMSETMLSIIRHILRGEQIIAERTMNLVSEESSPGTSTNVEAPRSSTANSFQPTADVNADHLKQLMDMGFSKDHSTEALLHSANLEQATDYLLNNPPSTRGNSSMDLDLTEDYQMLRAIAMSLGDKSAEDTKDPEKGDSKKTVDDVPLTEDVINHFTKGALAACLNLLDTLPDTVYRVCVLLVTITKRNGTKWREDMLTALVAEISENVLYLISKTESDLPSSEIVNELINSEAAAKAAVRIYLFTLLFEGAKIKDMRIPNTEVVQCSVVVPSLVKLLIQGEQCMTAAGNVQVMPKWLPPLLLLINLIEKVALIAQRQEEMELLTNPLWKSYDIVSGRWIPFTASNNKIINEAYHNGEDECRIVSGRQRYIISFRDFHQSELELGSNVRSIIRTPKCLCKDGSKSKESGDGKSSTSTDTKSKETTTEEDTFKNRRRRPRNEYELLHQVDSGKIVASCVRLMTMPVDRDTLHALMRICLRYTRDHENATIFAKEGGVKILLETTQGSSYTGFVNLATLLIRHIIEEPRTLWLAMENVVRICTMANVPPQFRDLFYLSTRLSSALSRNHEVYQQMAQSILRVDINVLNRRNPLSEDNRLLLKSIPSPPDDRPPLAEDSVAVRVIYDLLNALIKPTYCDSGQSSTASSSCNASPEKPISSSNGNYSSRSGITVNLSSQSTRLRRTPGHIDILRSSHDILRPENNDDDMPSTPILPLKSYRDTSHNGNKLADDEAKKPLLPKSAILKILAEAVRSYQTVATLITDYVYHAGQSEMITENTKALAFILDKLLPMVDNSVDRECCTTVRMLIASLASAHDSQLAQTAVVHEVKMALLRALAMPESVDKHNQLQLLTGLIPIMIENCPTENPSTIKVPYKRSDIFLIMLRKGLICDLARVPQYLDLSSPNMVATINATLKPLETLLRISNQPMHNSSKFKFKSPRKVQEEQGTSSNTTLGIPQLQGEEVVEGVEDGENNEHELVETADGLETGSNNHVHGEVDTGLEEIMDQLLERDLDRNAYHQQVAESHNMEIVDEPPNIENIGYNPDRDATEDMMSSESGDSNEDSNGSEPEDREMDEDADENEDEAEIENDPYDYDDPFEFYDDEVVQSLFRMRPIDRENENILMIQYPDPDHEGEHENSRRNLSSVHWSSNGLTFPFGLLDDSSNTNEAVLPPPHPLLMARHNMDPANVSVSRTQRANRQRRYHYLQIPNNTRDQNPPVILQRLLGPDSQSMPRVLSGGGFRDSRLLVMDNGFGIFTNSREEESIDFVDQSGDLFGPSLSISMHTNPTALNWWNQEAALLDGDSGVNLVLIVCSNLISDLEKHRAAELAKARGKRRKKLFDDDDKQKSQDKDETLTEAIRPMETEGENAQLLLENQSSATASARALAHWALENTTDEDSLNPSRHLTLGFNPELFTEPVLIESSQYGAENTRPEILNENSLLDEEPFLVSSADLDSSNSAASNAVGSNPVTAPSIVTSAVLTSSSNVENTFSNAAVQDPLDLIVGITGSPSRQGVTQGSLISISSNSWALSQEGAGSSGSASTAENNSVALPSNSDAAPSAAGSSSNNTNDIPDWVDPSFLAALPDEMRAEVLAEQMRLQRIRVRAQTMTADASPVGLAEVNPEFLAALPPAIQEEVLAQQRIEQQRQAAATANPNDPVDAAAFFQNLHPSLRQAILTDMEESQISVLPPELAAEAHNLRRDWESRNRQLMQERFLHQIGHSSNALSSILRSSRGIMGNHISNLHDRGGGPWSPWTRVDHTNGPHSAALALSTNMERTGRPLLDHESLACLLVLLFIDEPKFNTLRLHRVIRNLCSHVPTREWVIKSLLSIIERSNETNDPFPVRSMSSVERPQWLNISLDAALGCRANVFLMKRIITRRQKNSSPIAIHPQAASVVCKHTLELLISLAKSFPAYFLPMKLKSKKFSDWFTVPKDKDANKEQQDMTSKSSNDFWDILVRLDSTSSSRKGKGVLRLPKDFVESSNANKSFEASPFGQLITMLSYNVIKRSSQLTDKLLRLLSLISSDLPVMHSCPFDKNKSEENEECVPESEEHLQLAIQVLTSKSCSEDGLEDATALLLNLSHFSFNTRRMILHLLLDGAIDLSVMVQLHISNLVKELKTMNNVNREIIKDDHGESSKASKGTLKDRFTKDAVIVAAPSKTKATCDLQLPSMAPLISKTSSQAFFLRILKVIVQIREAVREESKNTQSKEGSSTSGMFDPPPLATSETLDEVNATEPPIQNFTAPPPSQDSANAMDTSAAVGETTVAENEDENDTPLLSEALDLQSLWNTLSQCLFELEETPDHHAVLVLQPAVEAFFLVHSSSQSKKNREQSTANSTNTQRESAGSSVNLPTNPSRNSGSVSPSLPVENNDVAPLSPLDGTSQGSESTNSSVLQLTAEPKTTASLNSDQKKFLAFAETHRTVLNQILRQTTTHLADGPFSVLVDHTRVLDFDVKRRYFRTELERLDEGVRREELAVHVRRSHIFEDSFRELYRRNPEEWKNRFYIVFEDEEGQDAGGLLREWYVIISRDIFNPMYALFTVSPGDRVTYMINSSSHCNPNHLCYYKFVGRVIAKAIYDNKLLECYFTRSFYKHILGIQVKHTDMESEDYSFYQGLVYLTEHNVSDLGYDLTFSAEVQEFGVTDVRDLIPNGRNIPVTEENKHEYIRRVCQMKMCGAIQQQLSAFLEGFYDIIPKRLISIFNEQELELLISGLPNVDIEDLKANTEYHKYQTTSIQIQWFWRSLRSFDQADRAKFLQFVTGTSKVPLQGFAALEGMNGVQKFQIHRDDRSTDRLPSAHTCFNQLDLPVYETYDKLRSNLMKAIHECSEGFGFA